MKRTVISLASLILFTMPSAWAAPVVSVEGERVRVDADGNRVAVVPKGDAYIFVFSGEEAPQAHVTDAAKARYGSVRQSVVDARGGVALQLSFARADTLPDVVVQRVRGGAPLPEVENHSSGVWLPEVADARMVVLQGGQLMVLPTSSGAIEAAQNVAGVRIHDTVAGAAFSVPEGEVVSLFQSGGYIVGSSRQGVTTLAASMDARSKVASVARASVDLVPMTPEEQRQAKALGVEDVRLTTERSEIRLRDALDASAVQAVRASAEAQIEAPKEVLPQLPEVPSAAVEQTASLLDEIMPRVQKPVAEYNEAMSVVDRALAQLANPYKPEARAEKEGRMVPKEEARGSVEGAEEDALLKAQNIEEERAMAAAVGAAIELADGVLAGVEDLPSDEVEFDAAWGDDEGADAEDDFIIQLEEGPLFVRAIEVEPDPHAVVGDLQEDSYLYKYKRIMEQLGQSFSRVKRDRVRLQLAKLAMAYNRPEEALSYIAYMPESTENPGVPEAEDARMLAGVANLMIDRGAEALPYLSVPTHDYEADRAIWLAVAKESVFDTVAAADLFEKNFEQVRNYPLPLQLDVYFSYARALLRLERVSQLKELMRDLSRYMPSSKLPPEGLLLLARANLLEKNDRVAETLLAQAAASDHKEVSFLAQYEFVTFLMDKGDIGASQAIKHLERLRYLWRGGGLEAKILERLGRMYIQTASQRKGLDRLKMHNVYYPAREASEAITETMAQTFVDLLSGRVPTTLDDLELLGVYYEYRELTPPNEGGDELIREVAQKMRMLGLFERAAKILEDQLKFRVKNAEERGLLGLRLADLYWLDGFFEQALNALVRTENAALSDGLYKERRIKHAEILFAQKAYDAAAELLTDIDDPRAREMRMKTAWERDAFEQIRQELEPIYDNVENLRGEWTVHENVDFLRLAVAYNALGRMRDLESLKKRYQHELDLNENLNDVMDFLLRDGGSGKVLVDEKASGLWSNLVKAFDSYHKFSEYYDALREEREEEKVNRKIFNRRMRQMTAPPRI